MRFNFLKCHFLCHKPLKILLQYNVISKSVYSLNALVDGGRGVGQMLAKGRGGVNCQANTISDKGKHTLEKHTLKKYICIFSSFVNSILHLAHVSLQNECWTKKYTFY